MSIFTEVKEKVGQWKEDGIKIFQEQCALVKQYLITCKHCKKENPISSWIFIQIKHYVRPHGCTGGDYWINGKTETCTITCPECARGNYLYNHPQKTEIVELADLPFFDKKMIFKDVLEESYN
ncbi:MAG: hypothetical protein AB1333_03145 [Patescibacteria group bacterium]